MKQVAENPFRPPRTALQIRRQVSNVLAIALSALFAVGAVVFLVYLIYYVGRQGIHFLTPTFFTQAPAAVGDSGGGVGPAIVGSLLLIGLSSLFGVPLGLFTGIYLAEFGRGRLAAALRFLVDMLTGIPTIIFGLFAWILIVVPSHSFSGLSGGVALGIIMIPTVTRATEDALRLVPQDLREGSVALGASQSMTIVRVVVPAALSAIVTGIILAIARVAGETAPLLMTAFGSPYWNYDVARPLAALPLQIFTYTLSPYQAQIDQAHAGAFVLLVLVVLTSLLVRLATGRFAPARR